MIRRALLLSLPLWGVMTALTAYGWLQTPEDAQIPIHWNAMGVADRWGGRAEAFSIIPATALVLTGLFALTLGLDPRRDDIRRSPSPHVVAWVGLTALMTVIQGVIALTATGVIAADSSLPVRITMLAVSVLVLALGNLLPKARPNWFLGVRTPWSMSSERAWDKSQRLGGWLMMLAGLAGIIGALALPLAGATILFLAGVLAAAVLSTAMSYVWWRQDPDRRK